MQNKYREGTKFLYESDPTTIILGDFSCIVRNYDMVKIFGTITEKCIVRNHTTTLGSCQEPRVVDL